MPYLDKNGVAYLWNKVKAALNGKANSCRKTIDLTSTTYDINTYYPVISAIPPAGFPRINLYALFDDCGSPSWSTHVNHNFSCNLDMLVRAGGYGKAYTDTLIRDYNYKFTNDAPHGYQQLDNSSTAVLWLRGGGKYYVETDFSTSWLIKTSEYTVSGQTVEPSATNPGVILARKSNIYADLNGNAASASAVKDSDNSRTTTIAYSKTGLDSAAWLAALNDYELRAISPENVRKSMNAFGFIQELGADVNLNDLTEEGYYSQKFSKDALTEDNYPIENAGLLKVFNRCEGIYIYQEYRAYNNSGIWYRTRYQTPTDSTWYPWKKVACINDIPSGGESGGINAVTGTWTCTTTAGNIGANKTSSCSYYKFGKYVTVYGSLPQDQGEGASAWKGLPFAALNNQLVWVGSDNSSGFVVQISGSAFKLAASLSGSSWGTGTQSSAQNFCFTYVTAD